MRFLFVYETVTGQARDLLRELLVTDVHVIVARRDEFEPRPEELELLLQHPGAEAAACQLNRKYRKNVLPLVRFTVEPRKFRIEDRQLRQWLLGDGDGRGDEVEERPRSAFEAVDASARSLLLHPNALVSADQVDEVRWAFAAKSAELLGQYSCGDGSLGPLREWASEHGVAFAANGRVMYRYRVEAGHRGWSASSSWHLKAGDNTTPERAARVYFTPATVAGVTLILVAYVGPHPTDGEYIADFGRVELGEPSQSAGPLPRAPSP